MNIIILRFHWLLWWEVFSILLFISLSNNWSHTNESRGGGGVVVFAAELRAQQQQQAQPQQQGGGVGSESSDTASSNDHEDLEEDDPLRSYTDEKQYPDIDEFHKYVDFAKKRQQLYQMPREDKATFEKRMEDRKRTIVPPKFKNEAWAKHREDLLQQQILAQQQRREERLEQQRRRGEEL